MPYTQRLSLPQTLPKYSIRKASEISILLVLLPTQVQFYKADYPCRNSDNTVYIYRRISSDVDCRNKPSNYLVENITFGQYFIAYVTFSYLELGLILEMILWKELILHLNINLMKQIKQ